MNKILLIGNSGTKNNIKDGQTVKVRLYLKKIKDEGLSVTFVDLEDFTKRPFKKLSQIKKGIKECDRIVLITAERGCRILIPYINRINRKYKKPFILPLIGIGPLHNVIDKLDPKSKLSFINEKNYLVARQNKKISSNLSQITYILPETKMLCDIYKEFFDLKNVVLLNNFRDVGTVLHSKSEEDCLKMVYVSRVWEEKGIFDLLNVVSNLPQKEQAHLKLDIYGPNYLSGEEYKTFIDLVNNNQNVNYLGLVDESKIIEIIAKYDLFVFPTKYVGEGTPGVIAESLIAGTPILTSNFSQAKNLLRNGYDSIFFEMSNQDDLKQKLLNIIGDKQKLQQLSANALTSGQKFTFEHEREKFLKYVCGQH